MDNKISNTLSSDDYNEVMRAIQVLREKMPFLISVSVSQRKILAKMGNKSVSFVNRCAEVASQYTEILPRNVDVVEVQKDVQLFNQLYNITTALSQIKEMATDTMTLAGAEAYAASLIIYDAAKRNQGAYGLEAIVKDLSQRFPGRKGKGSSTTASSSSTSSTAPASTTTTPTTTPTSATPASTTPTSP